MLVFETDKDLLAYLMEGNEAISNSPFNTDQMHEFQGCLFGSEETYQLFYLIPSQGF